MQEKKKTYRMRQELAVTMLACSSPHSGYCFSLQHKGQITI